MIKCNAILYLKFKKIIQSYKITNNIPIKKLIGVVIKSQKYIKISSEVLTFIALKIKKKYI